MRLKFLVPCLLFRLKRALVLVAGKSLAVRSNDDNTAQIWLHICIGRNKPPYFVMADQSRKAVLCAALFDEILEFG